MSRTPLVSSASSSMSSTPRCGPITNAKVVLPPPGTRNPLPTMQAPPPAVDAAALSQMEGLRLRPIHSAQLMNSYGVEIHKKFALAVACIVFVLLGAPVALRFPRGGVGLVIGVSLFVFATYYSFLIAGEELASRGMLPPWIAMWGANVLFTLAAIPLVLRMGRTSGSNRGGGISELVDQIRYRFGRRRDASAEPARA